MTTAVRYRATAGLAVVVSIWAVAWFAVMHARHAPVVTVAAAVDFAGTATLVLWLIAARRGHVPRWTLGATFAIGMIMAKIALGRVAGSTSVVLAAGLALEMVAIVSIVVRARRAKVPSLIARVLATELAVFSMLVIGWRAPRTPHRFTIHERNGWCQVVGVFVFLVLVETMLVHVLLAMYASALAAWIATGLSIYSALWLVGDALALRRGGVFVRDHEIEVRVGMRRRLVAPRRAIARIDDDAIEFTEPLACVGLFGRTRQVSRIDVSIDDPAALRTALAIGSHA